MYTSVLQELTVLRHLKARISYSDLLRLAAVHAVFCANSGAHSCSHVSGALPQTRSGDRSCSVPPALSRIAHRSAASSHTAGDFLVSAHRSTDEPRGCYSSFFQQPLASRSVTESGTRDCCVPPPLLLRNSRLPVFTYRHVGNTACLTVSVGSSRYLCRNKCVPTVSAGTENVPSVCSS